MMKQKSLLFAWAATILLLAGCSDDMEKAGNSPIVEGDEIMFGASSLNEFEDGYTDADLQTRTVYEDSYWDNNDNKWHYPLQWVHGDEISVYCPQASDAVKYTHYKIQWDNGSEGDISTDNTPVYMIKSGENGLHWGNTGETHKFYAFYPSSAIKNDEEFENGVIHGTIPNTQEMEWTQDGSGNWVGKPDMDLAFMRAYNEIQPTDVQQENVTLTFEPLTTAVEITLTASGDVTNTVNISQIQIMAENKNGDENSRQAVCGDFAYDIDKDATTLNNKDVVTDYMITVDCWHNNQPISLAGGKSMTFTVFLLPGTDAEGDRTLDNLKISVPGWIPGSSAGTETKTYEGVNIQVGTKSQIVLPAYNPTGTTNAWLGSLPDEVYISQLSIPGSVNAFSNDIVSGQQSSYEGEGNDEIDLTQTTSVEDQFNFGVRAFEIATERDFGLLGYGTTLRDGQVIAGETTNNVSFGNALQRLAQLVADNPSEFVIVMPYYAPNATSVGEEWSTQLRTYLQDLNGQIVSTEGDNVKILPFNTGMTIGDARGKILFLSRMPSSKSDVDSWVGNPQYTTAIYGWNSDKDRWAIRGYDTNTEGYWIDGQWNGTNNPKNAGYTEPTYMSWKYEAASPSGTPTYYIQDWFRVCPQDGNYSHFLADGSGSTYWYESKSEKISNITDFMDASITQLKGNTSGNQVFINSLAGYYVISKYATTMFEDGALSSIPYPTTVYPNYAKHGDIPPFARDMNDEVYRYILGLDYENRGPLGIMLINYAGVANAFNMEMHGDYIVQALIDNNFRFPLIGRTE